MTPQNLQDIEFEYHVSIVWEGTDLDDSERVAIGHDLFDSLNGAERIAPILNELQDKWDVSVAEQNDGRFAIYFNSSDEYEKFSKVALAVAGQDYVFEGDVLDLLRTYDKYDDLVALIWEPVYAIPNTLAKVLGLRDI